MLTTLRLRRLLVRQRHARQRGAGPGARQRSPLLDGTAAALTFAAGLLRAHLKKTGSRWRKLPPGKIALIVLATLRHDHRLADMAGGNGVSASTIHRRAWEIIGLPAARAPRLDRALTTIRKPGGEVVLPDGTLIPARRSGTASRRNHNGKHNKHGLLFPARTGQAGNLTRISSAARALVGHGFSDRKNRRSLTRLRIDPGKAAILLRALLVLTRQHTAR